MDASGLLVSPQKLGVASLGSSRPRESASQLPLLQLSPPDHLTSPRSPRRSTPVSITIVCPRASRGESTQRCHGANRKPLDGGLRLDALVLRLSSKGWVLPSICELLLNSPTDTHSLLQKSHPLHDTVQATSLPQSLPLDQINHHSRRQCTVYSVF